MKKRLERWHKHLPHEEQDPNAKEKFDKLTGRAAQPEKSEPGKPVQSDSYNEK